MEIRQVFRVSEQGYSRPYQCYDDNGVLRWCKGNHTGLRSLISEWICASIASRLDIPVPKFDILRLDPELFESWRRIKGPEVPLLVTEYNPFVFASTNIDEAKDVVDVVKDCAAADRRLLGRIYLFDEFVRNTDRTDGNSNLLTNASIHVIDHNNAFDPEFDAGSFAREHILRAYRAGLAETDVEAVRESVRRDITEGFLDDVWGLMPDAWTDMGSEILPLERVKEVLLGGRL